MDPRAPKEWDASAYHRISTPQQAWGKKVLERLVLRGDERIADAGCGSGRLTAELLDRTPRGHVVAIDFSVNMVAEARKELSPRYGDRVSFLEADLAALALEPPVDVVFSTATLHWIHDHPRLFASLFRSLAPGGRLVVQFGGPDNLERVHGHAEAIFAEPAYAGWMRDFTAPYYFPTAELTAERLRQAGFVDVATWTELSPATFDSDLALREFLERVIFRAHLARLGDEELGARFLDRMVEKLAADEPARTLDYVRLNADARRP